MTAWNNYFIKMKYSDNSIENIRSSFCPKTGVWKVMVAFWLYRGAVAKSHWEHKEHFPEWLNPASPRF